MVLEGVGPLKRASTVSGETARSTHGWTMMWKCRGDVAGSASADAGEWLDAIRALVVTDEVTLDGRIRLCATVQQTSTSGAYTINGW